jgi:hypothetical protein
MARPAYVSLINEGASGRTESEKPRAVLLVQYGENKEAHIEISLRQLPSVLYDYTEHQRALSELAEALEAWRKDAGGNVYTSKRAD